MTRGEGVKQNSDVTAYQFARKIFLKKYLCFIVRLLISKFDLPLRFSYASLLLVALKYLQNAKPFKWRMRLTREDYSYKL